MLLFTALSTKAVAQTYQKLNKDSVIFMSDTITVQKAVELNASLPLEKQVKRNEELFRAMRKPNGVQLSR